MITVFLPCYNAAKYIDTCIISILGQTYQDFVVFAYDDNSTDLTFEKLKQWQLFDKRIIAKRLFSKTVGYVTLLNQMLKECKSEFVFRHDADDFSLPTRFEKQIQFFLSNPKAILLGTKGINTNGDGTCFFTHNWEGGFVNPIASYTEKINSIIKTHHRVIHGTMAIRKEILLLLNGYNEIYRPLEDWDLCLRAIEFGDIFILPEVLYVRRKHKTNISQVGKNKKELITKIISKYNLHNFIWRENEKY